MSNEIVYFEIHNVEHTRHLADDLAKFIKENKLAANIQGKSYVNVEGWQYAGTRLGILPIVTTIVDLSDPGKNIYKYLTHVDLIRVQDNMKVGAGHALCSNTESGKKSYQEYAILSMAQTRAIGKAYRNMLAWIIRAAGYEPTPWEEMEPITKDRKEKKGGPAGGPAKKAPTVETASGVQGEASDRSTVDAGPGEQVKSLASEKSASVKQKTELLLLLNNQHITSGEKNKMITEINKMDTARMQKAIDNVKDRIQFRQREAERRPSEKAKEEVTHA